MEQVARLADMNERAREIFRQLVEAYIATGEPVGSRTLSRALAINLSPASVRNVMADLEDLGLIYAPHTSAGRMPTQQGLRFFVDAVMEEAVIDPDEQARIDAHLADIDPAQGMDMALQKASGILSGLPHCAGLVLAPRHDPHLKQVEFVRLSAERALVILVGEDGNVENRAMRIPADLPDSSLTRAANYLNAKYAGQVMSRIAEHMREELAGLRRELDELSAEVVAAGLAVWTEGAEEEKRLIVRGQANLIAGAKEQEDLERLQRLFEDLEEKREVSELLSLAEEGEGVRIFIGRENRLFSLSGSSVILSPFGDRQHDVVGVLGIIGPTRLQYRRLIPVVDYTARAISRLFS